MRLYSGSWAASGPWTTSDNKDVWRHACTASGVLVPLELARWTNGKLEWTALVDGNEDLVVKAVGGFMGIGDSYFVYGKDFQDKMQVGKLMAERPGASEDAIVMRRALPCDELGVHCLRIITAKGPSGKIGVLWTSIQMNSSSWTSHCGKHQYAIDCLSETIVGADQWIAITYAVDPAMLGRRLPGVRLACSLAIRAHEKNLETNPNAIFIGWDSMFTKNQPTSVDGVVFFEGNYAWMRLPRVVFSSWTTIVLFMWHFVTPFSSMVSPSF